MSGVAAGKGITAVMRGLRTKNGQPSQPPAAAAAEIGADQVSDGLLVKVPPSRRFPPGFQNALFSLDRERPVSLFSRREKRNGGFKKDQPLQMADHRPRRKARPSSWNNLGKALRHRLKRGDSKWD